MNLIEFYFFFEGRISRKEFWIKYILLMCLPAAFLTIFLGEISGNRNLWETIIMLILLWPSLAVLVKRWHDRNKSGWWILINIIPLIGPIWALIETGFLRGTAGENRFGFDPLEVEK